MQSLPPEHKLPVQHLAAAYNNVTNSYKFLWFLAILDEIEAGSERVISVPRLLGRMVADAWYPVNYFRINFGKQDILARLVISLLEQGKAPLHARNVEVAAVATREIVSGSDLGKELSTLGSYVPYRFIRPFFANALRGMVDAQVNRKIDTLADASFSPSASPCLYRFQLGEQISIELHPIWQDYIHRHMMILRGYTYWSLLNYLQQRNPGVPSLATKLFAPQSRNLSQARKFWQIALAQLGGIQCIYSGARVDGSYSLDHFLPWRFVAHDSLWNIVPTPKSVNSVKGDRLPDYTTYFERFAHAQFAAMQAVVTNGQHHALLEDYLSLLDAESVATLAAISFERFRKALHATLAPQFQIAANLGFSEGWTY